MWTRRLYWLLNCLPQTKQVAYSLVWPDGVVTGEAVTGEAVTPVTLLLLGLLLLLLFPLAALLLLLVVLVVVATLLVTAWLRSRPWFGDESALSSFSGKSRDGEKSVPANNQSRCQLSPGPNTHAQQLYRNESLRLPNKLLTMELHLHQHANINF